MATRPFTCGFCNAKHERNPEDLPFVCPDCQCLVDGGTSERLDTFFATLYKQTKKSKNEELDRFFESLQGGKEEIATIVQPSPSIAGKSKAPVRYTPIKEIGRGGMGRVLLVQDGHLGRKVAMKILKKELAGQFPGQRFLGEARITAQLEHPNIVPVYDLSSQEDGSLYFIMKCVQGKSLSDVIASLRANGKTKIPESSLHARLQIFQKICQAIEYAHSKGILHLDLKPANIMLGEFGEVLVLDWGIAKSKRLRDESRGGKGEFKEIVGTPAYMSPEQAEGDPEKIDERSDVYGLGAILHELMTFRPLFSDTNTMSLLFKVAEEEPEKPARDVHGRKVPKGLQAIIGKAIAKSRSARYSSVLELENDIRHFLDDRPLLARKDNAWDKMAREMRSNLTVSLGFIAATLFVVFLALAFSSFQLGQGRVQKEVVHSLLRELVAFYDQGEECYKAKRETKDPAQQSRLQGEEDIHWEKALLCCRKAIEIDPQAPVSPYHEDIHFLRYEHNRMLPAEARRYDLKELADRIRSLTDRYNDRLGH